MHDWQDLGRTPQDISAYQIYKLVSYGFREEYFFSSSFISIISLWQVMTHPGCGLYGPRSTAIAGSGSRIYKDENYTLLYTKYENSRPSGFREEDIFSYDCKAMGTNDPPGQGHFYTRSMIGMIYV